MIDIKDIAEIRLTNLHEGILDDIEVTMAKGDQFLDTQRFEKWSEKCKNKAYWRPTKKGWVLQGDFIINDIDSKEYSGPTIKTVKGNVYIMDCALENIKGLFCDGAVIEGSFTIQNCKNLNTLEGSPIEVDTFTVMECPKLKSLANGPVVHKNLYAMKNGKKFNADKLRDEIAVGKNIFCAIDNLEELINEGLITESLRNPHLIRLAKQLKEPKYKKLNDRWTKWDLPNILRGRNLYLDKLDSDTFKEYDGSDPKALTIARKSFARDCILTLCMNDKGRYTYLIQGHSVTTIDFDENSRWAPNPRHGTDVSVSTLEKIVKEADTVIFIYYGDEARTYKLQSEREDARRDALALQRGTERDKDSITEEKVRYYEKIAVENRQRYRKLAEKMRAEKKLSGVSNTFDKIKSRVDKVMEQYTSLMANMVKHPEKYSFWDIEHVSQKIKYGYMSHRTKSYTEGGLLVLLDRYMSIYISSRKGESYSSAAEVENKLKELETKILNEVTTLENKIKELMSK